MTWNPEFEVAFNPKTVAVVGASAGGPGGSATGGGAGFIRNFQRLGFQGRIYPIHPTATELLGLKVYPNLASVPEQVDLVIVSVPAPQVPLVLEDCTAANARNIHIFTAGFRETGTSEGRALEEQVRELARRGGLRIVGPNGMGLCYVPKARMTMWAGVPAESGPVSFLSQSGGHTLQFIHYAHSMGIRFSKVISFGNGTVLDSSDFLEYLGRDPETSVICLYVEGVRDGRRLLEVARQVNRTKPIIVWKGGLTEGGTRAAMSHTGSMSGEPALWEAFYKQSGTVSVFGLDEMADMVYTFLHLRPVPRGKRLGVVLGGGGYSVLAADWASKEGLAVPALALETQARLREFVPVAGTSVKNPLDVENVLRNADLFRKSMEYLLADPNVDMVFLSQNLDLALDTGMENIQRMGDHLIDLGRQHPYAKPIAGVIDIAGNAPDLRRERDRLQRELPAVGIPLYRTFARGVRTLSKFAEYHQFQGAAEGG